MVAADQKSKLHYQEQICLLLRRYPDGLKESEITQVLNLHRRRIHDYLIILEEKGYRYKEAPRWFADEHRELTFRLLKLLASPTYPQRILKQASNHCPAGWVILASPT